MYRGLRPNGTTFYQSEIPLLLPPKFPGFFPKWKAPSTSRRHNLVHPHYSCSENELVEFERKHPGLVARELGLLYKEESLKRLKPQHEYCFLHKTFQEYVAAAYIAEKLVNQQFNVFDHFPFADLVTKYPQVFIFVSGMLGEKATVLFTQIGEDLKKNRWDWNWNCNEKEATFSIQSFSESGHAEQMAATLCNFIPFPKVITLDLRNSSFVEVLMACKSLSNLQTPVALYGDTCSWEEGWCSLLDFIIWRRVFYWELNHS